MCAGIPVDQCTLDRARILFLRLCSQTLPAWPLVLCATDTRILHRTRRSRGTLQSAQCHTLPPLFVIPCHWGMSQIAEPSIQPCVGFFTLPSDARPINFLQPAQCHTLPPLLYLQPCHWGMSQIAEMSTQPCVGFSSLPSDAGQINDCGGRGVLS